MSRAARSAASAIASAASAVAPAAATASATTTAATSRTPAAAAISAVRTVALRPIAAANMRSAFAIEVRLAALRLIWKISAAFDHDSASRRSFTLHCSHSGFWRRSTAHLGALLFQNRFARQPDTVAFHGQHFHQHLVAFFQLIANIGNAMFGHFADVQESIGSRNNLDE